MIDIQVGNFPSVYDSSSPSDYLLIPPCVFLFLFDLSKTAHQLVVLDDKWVFHVDPIELSLVMVNTADKHVCFHVQRRKIMDVDWALLSIFISVFLCMSGHVLYERL